MNAKPEVYASPYELYTDCKGTYRATFKAGQDDFYVVKLFPARDVWSVKFWHGSYNRVKSYWRTKTLLRRKDNVKKYDQLMILAARKLLILIDKVH